MKNTQDLKVGDKIWTWDINEHKPVESIIVRLWTAAETMDSQGQRARVNVGASGSIYPDDFTGDQTPTCAQEVFAIRAQCAQHEIDYLKKQMDEKKYKFENQTKTFKMGNLNFAILLAHLAMEGVPEEELIRIEKWIEHGPGDSSFTSAATGLHITRDEPGR